MSQKILFFGPCPNPVTGQSLAFKEVVINYPGQLLLCNTTRFGNNRILNTIYCYLRLPLLFLFQDFKKIYFTCSRSKLGFLKDLPLLFLGKLTKKKIVNHLHGDDFQDFQNNSGTFFKALIKLAYKHVNTSIVLLPKMQKQFSSYDNMKVEVIPNCYAIDMEKVDVNHELKKNQLLYLSNIMKSKGILILLDALPEILRKNEHLKVKIAGLPMSDHLSTTRDIEKKFYANYGKLKHLFPNQIYYLGLVQGNAKINLLIESSIFVLPTFYPTEAFPLSIIEAMRCGNAIITTKHNYLGDIIKEDNGILVAPNSVGALRSGIEKLLLDKDRIMKIQKQNVLEAKSKYSPAQYISNIKSVIERL